MMSLLFVGYRKKSYSKDTSMLGQKRYISLTLALFFLLSSAQIAHAANPPAPAIQLQVDVGFSSFYRIGYWTPVQITLSNPGPGFRGTLAINTFSGQPGPSGVVATSPWSFEEPMT